MRGRPQGSDYPASQNHLLRVGPVEAASVVVVGSSRASTAGYCHLTVEAGRCVEF
jgi:hypothetical protein